MAISRRFKTFDDTIFERHPDLKAELKPNDQHPELMNLLKTRDRFLPVGTTNTKVIMNEGEIVERVYKTPKGDVISIFSKSSKTLVDQAA